MSTPLKILVVEDDAIISMKIATDLKEAGHSVVGIEYNSERALDRISNQSPDLVLLDINIQGSRDGIEIGLIIKEKYDIPFIFLTAFSDINTLNRAKKAEPCAYLVKPYKAADLFSSITIGLFNYQSRKQSQGLSLDMVNQIALSMLSEREFEILEDITLGLTNAQIAEKQFISTSTVKWHLQNLYSKLGVRNRTSAVKKVLGV
jgi:DNA-binding NarL/FixJ family response regulator